MTEKLLGAFKTRLEEVALQPSGGGRFEVSADSEVIYSKAETGRFPTVDEVQKAIEAKM